MAITLLRLSKWALSAVYLVNQCKDFDKSAKDTLGMGERSDKIFGNLD